MIQKITEIYPKDREEFLIGIVKKKDILTLTPKDFEEIENNYNFRTKMRKKYGVGTVLSYKDFEAIRKDKKRKVFLIALLSLLIAFFLFKNAFALYGTTYLPNGQKAYKNMDTGQIVAPCECKCD